MPRSALCQTLLLHSSHVLFWFLPFFWGGGVGFFHRLILSRTITGDLKTKKKQNKKSQSVKFLNTEMFFCELCFNEGNPFMLWFLFFILQEELDLSKKKRTVLCNDRWEHSTLFALNPVGVVSWSLTLWSHTNPRARASGFYCGVCEPRSPWLFVFHTAEVQVRFPPSQFLLLRGNKYWVVKCHWFAISVPLTRPEERTWGIRAPRLGEAGLGSENEPEIEGAFLPRRE